MPTPNPAPSRAGKKHLRSDRGMAMVVLVFGLAIFVIGVIGLFGFEVTRTNVARQELQHICEAAALAGAAAMPTPFQHMTREKAWVEDDTQRNDRAKQAASQCVISNSILQTWMANVAFTDSRESSAEDARKANPGPGDAAIYFEVLDWNDQPCAWGWDKGYNRVHVIGAFGVQPAFGKYCGIEKVVVYGEAIAPIPWIQTFHSDWTWQVSRGGAPDPTDNNEYVMGSFWDPTDPKPTVTALNPWEMVLNIPESPGGFMTALRFKQRYGYFQVIGKFDSKQWAKFWLTNTAAEPSMPQFDVVSSYGGISTAYQGILHQSAGPGDVTNQPTQMNGTADLSKEFHAYGLMWVRDKPDVYFMLDGKVVGKAKKFASTDSKELQVVIGNSADTVSKTSTGSEPPAQFLTVDAWQMNPEFTPQNDSI